MAKIIYVIIAIVLMPHLVFAGELAVGIKEAIDMAFRHNHELQAFNHSLMSAKQDLEISKSYLLPNITFEERFLRTDNPTYSFMSKLNQSRFSQNDFVITSLNNPSPVNDFQTSIQIHQPIFVKKLYTGIDISKSMYEAKSISLQRKKEEIARGVLEAYLAVKTSKEFVDSALKGIEEAKEHLRVAELRYKNNLGLFSDTLRAQTALKEAEQNLLKATKNHKLAKMSLGLILGQGDLVDIKDDKLNLTTYTLEHYKTQALRRADILAMQKQVDIAQKNITLSTADYYPMLGLSASYQLNDPKTPFGSDGSSWLASAYLRWNIFDGLKSLRQRSKAKYTALEASENLEAMKKAVSYKVYEAYQNYEEAVKSYELASKALETALEGLRYIKVRYENALATIVDLLNAQSSVDSMRANKIAKKNDIDKALINLAFESGILLDEIQAQGK